MTKYGFKQAIEFKLGSLEFEQLEWRKEAYNKSHFCKGLKKALLLTKKRTNLCYHFDIILIISLKGNKSLRFCQGCVYFYLTFVFVFVFVFVLSLSLSTCKSLLCYFCDICLTDPATAEKVSLFTLLLSAQRLFKLVATLLVVKVLVGLYQTNSSCNGSGLVHICVSSL